MKLIKFSIIRLLIAFVIGAAALSGNSFASTVSKGGDDGFAVLELFTSEGCSICPEADELLAHIQQDAGGKPVYVLAYHVDYWDNSEWKDVFSSSQYSKRQYQYSQQFSGELYTPQVIVNGNSAFVGNDKVAADLAVQKALGTKANLSLSLIGQQSGSEMKVDFKIKGNLRNNKLLVAVVEKHVVHNVTGAENKGRTLANSQIVRKLCTFNLEDGHQGSEKFELPAGFNVKDWEIVGLLQNTDTGVINAACRARLAR